MHEYLKETKILNYTNFDILNLIENRGWKILSVEEKIRQIYNYVKDEMLFGYNKSDDISASKVLADGYGQCNTKNTLFMALLRAASVHCRLHGFTVNKELQKGAIDGIWYKLAPKEILHSWVEVDFNGKWLNMEGLILDHDYVRSVQNKFKDCTGKFCGYAIATDNFQNPQTEWTGDNTYIQKEAITNDFGIFDSPDDFYKRHGTNLKFIKKFIFKNIARHLINYNIRGIRKLIE